MTSGMNDDAGPELEAAHHLQPSRLMRAAPEADRGDRERQESRESQPKSA
jgi:hypothetical protein